MYKYHHQQSSNVSILFLALAFSSNAAFADISGKVFHDFNTNGTPDITEAGVAGVTVTATDAAGNTANATTAADGTYTFPNSGSTASGNKVRLEFSNLPEFANSGGSTSGTTTQFITANATNVNFAVTYADNFCQANPKMATPLYRSGANNAQVLTFSYNNEGLASLDKTNIADSTKVGSLWGVAYSRSQKLLYAAAVLKRHIPLGSGGLDAIYTIDPATGAPNATPWLQLTDDLGIAVSSVAANPQYQDNAARGVDAPPQNDVSAFTDAMKVGIGDIELSADEKTLYAMNAYDKKVYAIDVATKTLKASYAVPDASCSSGQSRPWALGKHQGKIYAGVTCDGSASGNPANLTDNSGINNLKASVYRLDASSFTQVLDVPLNYKREAPFYYDGDDSTAKCRHIDHWKPWTDVLPDTCADGNISYPSPLLADIEFDDKGDMVLSFTDRTGFQIGHKNYGPTGTTLYSMYAAGDILKACKTASGWGIEGTVAGCSSAGGLAINQDDTDGYPMGWGVLPKAGEFYEGDYFHGDGNTDGTGLSYYPGHPEITIGGLAVVPNTGEVMSTTYDPVTGGANYGTGGVITLNNQSGKRARNGFELYRTADDADPTTSSKGVGLGDLEVLCDPAPLEVGNRVWRDTDADGIQDADEDGIAGVEVVLTCGASTATATTASNGQYLFSSVSNATFLIANNDCKITVAGTQASLTGVSPTLQNADSATDNNAMTDIRDSDANATGEITFKVGSVGENNHALDIGYKEGVAATIHSIGNRVWLDANNNGTADLSENAAGAGVKLDLKDDKGVVLQSTNTDAQGHYLFHGLAAGSYQVCLNADNFTTGAVLANHTASTGKTPAPNADTDNTDGDDNGSDDTAAGLCATLVTLGTDEPTGETTATGDDGNDGQSTADANSNLTVDFGVVPPKTDLALSKTVDKPTVKQGDTVIYTITITNNGPDPATGVTVTDKLPSTLEYLSDDGQTTYGSDVYDDATGIWQVGNLAKNESKLLKITAKVK